MQAKNAYPYGIQQAARVLAGLFEVILITDIILPFLRH